MRSARLMKCGALTATVALAMVGASTPADAGGYKNRVIEVEDRCDPETFNAALDPEGQSPVPPCVDNDQGSVTFDKFVDRLQHGGDDHWAFKPSKRTIERGDRVTAVNVGGEFHTFTEVTAFGQGCVEELNGAVRHEGPVLILGVGPCPTDPQRLGQVIGATGMGADDKLRFTNLSAGEHKFECLIHPWMRTTIKVKAD